MVTQGSGASPPSPLKQVSSQLEDLAPDWGACEAYGEPIFFDSHDVPEISGKDIPGWLGEYSSALSEYTQTPPAMAAMLALATVAACVQKRYEITPDGYYKEPLSLWVAVALPPASRKTAVISALTAPLSQWERKRAVLLAPAIDAAATERDVTARRIEFLTKQAAQGKTSGGKSSKDILNEIAQLKADLPKPVRVPQVFVSDTTSEGLRNLLAEQDGRMAVISDEGCIFEILGGLYSDSGAANLDVFLKGHAGGPLRVKRANQTVDIENIAISFGLAIQPEIISELSSGNKRSFRGKGLLARYLFVIPRSNIGTRVIGSQRPIPPDVQQRYFEGIHSLLSIPQQYDANGSEQSLTLVLSSEAKQRWLEFAQWIESHQGEGGRFERIQDFTGKLAGQALRIAGLVHIAEHHNQRILEVTEQTMKQAIAISKKLLAHAIAAFDSMGADPVMADAKFALSWALNNVEHDKTSFNHHARYIKQNALHRTNRFKNSPVSRVPSVFP